MKASKFYYLGDYKAAAQLINSENHEDAPFVIGALVFRGEHEKARRHFKGLENSLSDREKVFINFHLGISYTRTSEYEKAKELFINNWRLRHDKSFCATEKFLIYQGLSFFRYFFSRHQSSLGFAGKAREEIEKEESSPALYKALVYDLLAHNYYQLGKVAKGETHLKKAFQIAKDFSFTQLEEEFEASLAIYRSHYAVNLNKSIQALKRLLKKTSETNDYTCSEVVLQISKLYLLKGKYKEANDFLIKNFNTIYKNDNRRKIAKLNTLLAQLMIPRGQYMEVLSLLKVAKGNLNRVIDLNLLAPILGTEIHVLKKLGQSSHDQEEELKQLLSKTDKGILHQINDRDDLKSCHFNKEDTLGVLFDQVDQKDVSVLEDIIKFEVFHLVRRFFGDLSKQKALILHPQNKGLFIIDESEVTFCKTKLSQQQVKLLSLLSVGPCSKEALIEGIWGYQEYDPIRHDHLVYSLMRRTRKILGDHGQWIQSTGEDLYYLDSQVQFLKSLGSGPQDKESREKGKRVHQISPVGDTFDDLNFRQLQVLEGAFEKPFSTGDMVKYFGTTRMTSYRDLDDLVERGLLSRRGNKRGARYWYA